MLNAMRYLGAYIMWVVLFVGGSFAVFCLYDVYLSKWGWSQLVAVCILAAPFAAAVALLEWNSRRCAKSVHSDEVDKILG
jgi:hypothetical protein